MYAYVIHALEICIDSKPEAKEPAERWMSHVSKELKKQLVGNFVWPRLSLYCAIIAALLWIVVYRM